MALVCRIPRSAWCSVARRRPLWGLCCRARENRVASGIAPWRAPHAPRKSGRRVSAKETRMNPEIEALDRLGDQIAELSAHIEVATARLLDMIREFDARCGWGNGFKSCAEWLSWRVGMDLGAAYERVRTARALPELPLISAAFARGEVFYSKVRALTRMATPQTEERLLTFARSGTAAHVERLVRAWRRVNRNAENQDAAQRHKSRSFYVYQVDGMFVIRGRLTP